MRCGFLIPIGGIVEQRADELAVLIESCRLLILSSPAFLDAMGKFISSEAR